MAGQGAEARVVVGIGLDLLGEHLEAVELGGALGGDRSGSLELVLDDPLGGSRGVVLGAHLTDRAT